MFSDDREWYGSAYYNDFRRKIHSDDLLISVLPMPEIGIAHGFGGDRPRPRDPMGRREIVCAALIHQELQHRWERLLAQPASVEKSLPPRLAELLVHMRGADSEKQIATKMGLSIHTVHNHVRRLYARFHVSGRSELMMEDNTQRPVGVPQLGCAGL
ncbi:MAG TPA: LuxR C-terminal-related transcriptional regulator [Tepidisphaeraceae bacterium]|jgi:DNA-binding CsgD family transcriptional regulator|nr:LuxR C-terminal-related transcriptional regulator [Tepidisphaeraceae bacterium]